MAQIYVTFFQQSLKELGIIQMTSSACHPQSQGALERYYQTLKTMLRKCAEKNKTWDIGFPYLFAIREMTNESLGFSPFQLMFYHEVRGIIKNVKITVVRK